TRYVTEGVAGFNYPVEILDRERNQRLRLNRYSIVADLIRERAVHPKVAFRDLFQADVLLFLRGYLPEPGASQGWFPRCIGYCGDGGTLEVFAKATSPHGLEALKRLLRVKDLPDLYEKLVAALQKPDLGQILNSQRFWRISIPDLLNLQEIQRRVRPTA